MESGSLYLPILGCPPGFLDQGPLPSVFWGWQGGAIVGTETGIVWTLSVHTEFPWCQLEIRRGCPGLSRVEETEPGLGYSCVTGGTGRGGGSHDTGHLFPKTCPPTPLPV